MTSRSSQTRRSALAWAIAIAWAGFVFGLGSDSFSLDSTSRFLEPMLRWLLPALSAAQRMQAIFMVRECAHAIEYGVFALLLLRALWMSGVGGTTALALALAVPLGLAIADETRQGASTLRTGSGADVALDFAGAAMALLLLHALPAGLRDPLFPRRGAKARSVGRAGE